MLQISIIPVTTSALAQVYYSREFTAVTFLRLVRWASTSQHTYTGFCIYISPCCNNGFYMSTVAFKLICSYKNTLVFLFQLQGLGLLVCFSSNTNIFRNWQAFDRIVHRNSVYAEQLKQRKELWQIFMPPLEFKPRILVFIWWNILRRTCLRLDSFLALIHNLVRTQRLRYHNWLVCNQKPVIEWAVHGPKLWYFADRIANFGKLCTLKLATTTFFQIPSHTHYLI